MRFQEAPHSEPPWPPRSPREALLSTPAGRQRYKQALEPSPSPSPSRRARPISAPAGVLLECDEDEDEETLQLRLQEIQARLRLKKLQNARVSENGSPQSGRATRPQPAPGAADPRLQPRGADGASGSTTLNQVQVPASPIRKVQAHHLQTSPSRVLLGIDKGLKAKDVSLKRAPGQRITKESASSHNREYLVRSRSSNLPAASSFSSSEPPISLSFNEKLAQSRTNEAARAHRLERIQKVRSNSFGIGEEDMEQFKRTAVDIPDEPLEKPPTFSREQILFQGKPKLGELTTSNSTSGIPSMTRAGGGGPNALGAATWQDGASAGDGVGEKESPSFEPYSSFHLSRRTLPHRVLARHVSGKKALSVKELLRDVKAPDYSLPDVEQDIVVFAIVAKKSEPRAHKQSIAKKGSEGAERGKYMVLTLVDLAYELDLFLFNSGFTRFWKLTEGTVVAILNPSVMPPPPGRQDTGRFSLVINSDADTILEIGSARDVGFCQSIKKDGTPCGSWVNKKRTQFCEYHSNEAVRKQRSKRLEVNSSGFGGWERGKKKRRKEWEEWSKSDPDSYDREPRTQWFASRTFSASDLLDGKDRGPADKKEKSEILRRRLEVREKEHEMKKLGRVGKGAGREYMQKAGDRGAGATTSDHAKVAGKTDGAVAISLGLQRDKERRIHLSPIKRKRAESSQGSSTTSSAKSSGYGWGRNLKDKLARMKDGEEMRVGGRSPLRKKTRFVTDKGIREAGRDSLGMEVAEGRVPLKGGDDDDELIIVK